MSDEIYTNTYYLTQYIRVTVCIRKLCCIILLTPEESALLQEEFKKLTFEKLEEFSSSSFLAYKIY